MYQLDVWNGLLLALGGLIAVSSLVRLMRSRRDEVLGQLTAEARKEQERKKSAEMAEKRKKKRRAA